MHPGRTLLPRPLIASAFLLSIAGLALISGPTAAQEPKAEVETRTPYRVEFRYPLNELIGDLESTERGNRHDEASIPHGHWYSRETLREFHSWGPGPRHYPPVPGLEGWPVERKRERVVAVAMRYLGYGYQHHHIPDWDPPRDWPWQKTAVGHNGKGVDCSNLTGFVYNQGFGIRMNTDVHKQAELVEAEEGNRRVRIHRVELPSNYEERVNVLRTGDLLYIRGKVGGPITHVVLWVGPIGKSREGVPLLIDSHGGGVKDEDGRDIPVGVHLRPFRENSWYNRCASHAHRFFVD